MKNSSQEPDFGATGQFEMTGVYFADKKADAIFATTLGMERVRTLLLLGAGQAHLQVLSLLASNRRSDLDVTLITPWSYRTHGGMVPGFIAGHYPLSECQINLEPLISRAGARWINARCSGLDAGTQSVMLDYGGSSRGVDLHAGKVATNRPALLSYDYLSIDTGAAMEKPSLERLVPGAFEHGLMTRPTEQFVNRWSQAFSQAQAAPDKPWHVTVVGSDASATELVLAMQHGLHAAGVSATVRLLVQAPEVAPECPKGVRRRLEAQLRLRQVEVILQRCKRVRKNAVELEDGQTLPSDITVIATGAAAPHWLEHSGLARDADGFALVNAFLQSTSHPNVFAAGGVASRLDRPNASPDAYTPQAGSDLALNLLANLTNQPLRAHASGSRSVSFITCGSKHAVASWGQLSTEGAWAWRWKDKADRAVMTRYSSN